MALSNREVNRSNHSAALNSHSNNARNRQVASSRSARNRKAVVQVSNVRSNHVLSNKEVQDHRSRVGRIRRHHARKATLSNARSRVAVHSRAGRKVIPSNHALNKDKVGEAVNNKVPVRRGHRETARQDLQGHSKEAMRQASHNNHKNN